MNAEQSTRIAAAFAREAARSPTSSLCAACIDVLVVTGAGITVMSGGQTGPVCVSSLQMAALEDLQFTMGEGPCQDAFHFGRPVLAPRLDLSMSARWPSFVELAQETGIGAVFAYPMSTKGAKVGVLTLYQEREGSLTTAQHNDSVALAAVLTETVLSLQDAAPDGTLAAELEDAVAYRAEIHQASGMVSIQLGIPVSDALLRIRAHAYGQNQPVGVVAAEIVARRLRLGNDRSGPGEGRGT